MPLPKFKPSVVPEFLPVVEVTAFQAAIPQAQLLPEHAL
jgi:hypothetical protein